MSNGLDHPLLSIALSVDAPVHFGSDLSVDLPGAYTAVPLARPEFDTQDLTALLDELYLGVLLVSSSGQVIHANQASRDAMANSGLLSVQAGQLCAATPAEHKALLAALTNANNGVRSLLSLSANGASLLLSVVPPANSSAAGGGSIALFFQRQAICDTSVFLMFARNFGLTPTEQQVLTFICRSWTTPEIAEELNVAVSTIRSHVRSLCYKTASKGARELINRIAVLPPAGYSTRLQMH